MYIQVIFGIACLAYIAFLLVRNKRLKQEVDVVYNENEWLKTQINQLQLKKYERLTYNEPLSFEDVNKALEQINNYSPFRRYKTVDEHDFHVYKNEKGEVLLFAETEEKLDEMIRDYENRK